MKKLIIFETEEEARDLIAKIDREMGWPNDHTKTWQESPVRHPEGKRFGVWVKDREPIKAAIRKHGLNDAKIDTASSIEALNTEEWFSPPSWVKPDKPKNVVRSAYQMLDSYTRPAIEASTKLSPAWKWIAIGAAAAAGAAYYFL